MSCPEMSDFSAWINLQPPGPSRLIVVGKVVTTGGDLQPKLRESVSPSINSEILLLDLTIEKSGSMGTDDVSPRDVRFEKAASQGEYSRIEIRFEGEACLSLDVQEVH